jgi:Tfp pilus assembly protein PilF
MKKNIRWSFIVLLTVVIAYSASSEEKFSHNLIDSLRKELTKEKGSDKLSTQLDLALRIMRSDQVEALGLAKSALSEAQAAKNEKQKMRSYLMLGKIYGVLDNKDLAEAYYDSALTITKTSGDNWYRGEILLRKGEIKHFRNEDIQALEYLNASLQACRLSNNFKIMGSSYTLMGAIFRINGLYDRAIEYMVNSKLYFEKAGFLEGYAWNSYNLGRIY